MSARLRTDVCVRSECVVITPPPPAQSLTPATNALA